MFVTLFTIFSHSEHFARIAGLVFLLCAFRVFTFFRDFTLFVCLALSARFMPLRPFAAFLIFAFLLLRVYLFASGAFWRLPVCAFGFGPQCYMNHDEIERAAFLFLFW